MTGAITIGTAAAAPGEIARGGMHGYTRPARGH